MAWTAPHTWITNDLANEGDPGANPEVSLNIQLRDNQLLLVTPITTATGKIAALNCDYWTTLSGAAVTGVAYLGIACNFTGVQNFNSGAGTVRFVAPVGTDKWAT
jgi:hypothetical protein